MHGTAIIRPDHLAKAAFARRELLKKTAAAVAGSVVGLAVGTGTAAYLDRSPSTSTPVVSTPATAAPPRYATGP